ncbi:MAG: FemAB family PEP-CTERM system-associated protein [Deltaproteobacteria bacterium]|nr:FemAB family PEP-CTERM system-associated protein [Deltaproteobacteria bacterium]
MFVRVMEAADSDWDDFVRASPVPSLYNLSGWIRAMERAYKHKTYYLVCYEESDAQVDPTMHSGDLNSTNYSGSHNIPNTADRLQIQLSKQYQISGILPLVHMKCLSFVNRFVSLPFSDYGGILSGSASCAKELMHEALNISKSLKIKEIELRHIEKLNFLNETVSGNIPEHCEFSTRTHKVRMILNLPKSSSDLYNSFKSKLKNDIRKPQKEGVYVKVGGTELAQQFYAIFSRNMRDLGSPVHSKKLILAVLEEFGEAARILMVYKQNTPLACGLIVGAGKMMTNPWASSLRRYRSLSPNMMLYWKMLEYACDQGFSIFDFGRSTPGEGTYRFKRQWGARAYPLAWQYLTIGKESAPSQETANPKFSIAASLWKRLPVPMANFCGPFIRKHISL